MLRKTQQKFVEGILKGLTQEQAYIHAGYKHRGKGIRSCASQVMTNSNIQAAIKKAEKPALKKVEASVERSMQELALIAYNDPVELMDPEGNPKPISEIPENSRRALQYIQHISHSAKGGDHLVKVHYKLHDKVKALSTILQKFGVLASNQINVNFTAEILAFIVSQFPDQAQQAKLIEDLKKQHGKTR